MKKIQNILGKFGLPIYFFFLGCSMSIGIAGLTESEFENEILSNIAKTIKEKTKGLPEENQIDTTIILCHYLQERRSEILGSYKYQSFKASIFISSLQSFYIGTGACGYYTLLTTRVFQKLGYQPKIIQQRVNDRWGAHICLALPLKSTGKLILLDPLFRHTFRDSQNQLSTLQQVSGQWKSYYSLHTPANYNPNYNYQQGWRHTNWDKYGASSRSLYKILVFCYGKEKTDLLSLRTFIIDSYKIQALIAFLVSGMCIAMIAFTWRSGKNKLKI